MERNEVRPSLAAGAEPDQRLRERDTERRPGDRLINGRAGDERPWLSLPATFSEMQTERRASSRTWCGPADTSRSGVLMRATDVDPVGV